MCTYNIMFAFTLIRGKVDTLVNHGSGAHVYRISGQNYHLMGSLIHQICDNPKFS